MAKNSRGKKKKNNTVESMPVRTERYNIRTLHEDREYGLYWYDWLWKILRPVLIFICSLLIVIGIVSYGYQKIYDSVYGPVNRDDTGYVRFEIASGTSATAIGTQLENANLIQSSTAFKYMILLGGLTNKISYGSYDLSPSMTLGEVVAQLTGDSITNERIITIVPGWTCEEIANYLLREGAISSTEEFLRLCNDVDRFVADSYALRDAQDAGSLPGRRYALEGYLAPDTYRVFRTAKAEDIISTLLKQNNVVIDRLYYAQDVEYRVDENGEYIPVETYRRDLSMDEYMILASMIEKEAAKLEDYARVSAVFHNRLKQGMKLESDPTATYLSGLNHYILTQQEVSDKNLYNTYVVPGLPIGPICNPSTAALKAALEPDMEYVNRGYLYFCATDPSAGELVFAVTREEHLANVAKYQQLWADYDALHAS